MFWKKHLDSGPLKGHIVHSDVGGNLFRLQYGPSNSTTKILNFCYELYAKLTNLNFFIIKGLGITFINTHNIY